MRIVVVGAGVIGSIYGGRLAQSGHDVTLLREDNGSRTSRRTGWSWMTPTQGNARRSPCPS